MTKSLSTSLNIKFFYGFLLDGEIKAHLYQNAKWKEASLFHNQVLQAIKFKEKEYLGFFMKSPLLYSEIKANEDLLKEHLKFYCPDIQLDKNKIYLFPQIFVS